jgi:hypothetical protein
MKSVIAPIALACLLSGCLINPYAGYVKQHPELTQNQKNMFLERRVYAGTDVAGLTKDQIRKIMGKEPTQYTKSQGVDAWIYEKEVPFNPNELAPQLGGGPAARMGIKIESTDPETVRKFTVTTIFFNGDVATHAELSFDEHPR